MIVADFGRDPIEKLSETFVCGIAAFPLFPLTTNKADTHELYTSSFSLCALSLGFPLPKVGDRGRRRIVSQFRGGPSLSRTTHGFHTIAIA